MPITTPVPTAIIVPPTGTPSVAVSAADDQSVGWLVPLGLGFVLGGVVVVVIVRRQASPPGGR